MARNELVLLDPNTMPVKAMISALDQASLGPGEWAQLDNLRHERGILVCRGGMSASLGNVLTSSSFRGIWTGYLWGSYTILVALETSSAVRVYKSTNATTWTEVTDSATRFSAAGTVRFTVVPDPLHLASTGYNSTNTERLLMANGIDSPRCATSGSIAIVQDVIPQSDIQDREVKVKIVEFYGDLQAAIAYTNTAGKLEGADAGSAPNKVARISIDTTITQGATVVVDTSFSGTVLISDVDRQVLIGLDTAYGAFWDKFKLEVGTSGGYITIWDPSTPGTYARPVGVAIDSTQKTIWAFPWSKLAAGAGGVYDRFRLTWAVATSQAPSVDQTADVFLYGFTYGRNAKADYSIGVTNASVATCTESPGTIYSTYSTQLIKDIGGPVLNEVKLPRSPVLKAVYYAPYQNVTANEKTALVEYANFYVKETGSKRYRYWYRANTVFGGNYVFGSAAGDITYIFAGPDLTVATDSQAINIYPLAYMPDAFNIAIPKASEVCWANNRLFVGKIASSNQQLVISEFKNAFRCRQFDTIENGAPTDDTATILSLGNEKIQAIVPQAASTAGSSTVFIFTDQNIYAVSGFTTSQLSQLGRVANIGTQSPLSICADKGSVFFVDNEMQARVLARGSIDNLSRQIVDNKLKGAPGSRRKWVCGAVHGDMLYLAYSESTTNNRLLVFDLNDGIWVTDTPPIPVEGIVSWFDGSNLKLRLIAIGLDGTTLKGYEYDLSTQTQDLGTTNITTTLEPYELHSPDAGLFHVGRVKAMIDDVDSASATITRTYYPSGTSQATTLSLNTSVEHIYREDRIEGATVTGSGQPVGPRCRVTFSVPLTAGKRIRYLSTEFTPLGGGHDRP